MIDKKWNYCELVRREYGHDREFCVYPHREVDGLIQVRTIAYSGNIILKMKFFEPEVQVWLDIATNFVKYLPGNEEANCFMIFDFASHLYKHCREKYWMLVYSLFFNAKRLIDVDATLAAYAAIAVDAAFAATYDATLAAIAARDAARHALHARGASAHASIKVGLRELFKARRADLK